MIDISLSETRYAGINGQPDVLQQYLRAMLARQQALDLLDSIHHQINEVWAMLRRLLEGSASAARAAKAVRVARAAQAAKAQDSYRTLEKRRADCIAALHQAERRAQAAMQSMLSTDAEPLSRPDSLARSPRRKLKTAWAAAC
jgi:hypothetical protein